MDNSNLKRIHLSLLPSFEVLCREHHHTGELPCPWPDCPNGIREDSFLGVSPGIPGHEEKKYIRKSWKALNGDERFTWDDTTFFSGLSSNKIIREEILRCLGPEPQFPETIYHYTSVEGLFNIIKTNNLWLTDYEYMNDSSEIIHGFEVAQKILKEIEKESQYSEKER